jgi:hypothetical protein
VIDDQADRPLTDEVVGADNSSFRKGLVFGLTLAEVMLLLVFMLLLALGAMLKAAEDRANELEARANRAAAAEGRLAQALQQFAPGASAHQVQEWVRELIATGVTAEDNNDLRERLEKAAQALTQVDSAAVQTGLASPPASGTAMAPNERQAAQEARWQEVSETVDDAMSELRALRAANAALQAGDQREIAKQLTEAKLENERLQGTVAYAQRRLEDLGRGTERPACWANAQGRPEYIFEVDLSAAGISIRDRRLPHRAAQQAQLPTRSIQFGRALSPQEFRAQTRPLFDWGEQRQCRFFVIANDRTGATQKEIFKLRLRVMEERFYKFLAN